MLLSLLGFSVVVVVVNAVVIVVARLSLGTSTWTGRCNESARKINRHVPRTSGPSAGYHLLVELRALRLLLLFLSLLKAVFVAVVVVSCSVAVATDSHAWSLPRFRCFSMCL